MESSARLHSLRQQTSQEQEKLLMESEMMSDSQGSMGLTGGANGAEKMTSPSHLEFTQDGHTISKEYQEELRMEEAQFWNRARDMPR